MFQHDNPANGDQKLKANGKGAAVRIRICGSPPQVELIFEIYFRQNTNDLIDDSTMEGFDR